MILQELGPGEYATLASSGGGGVGGGQLGRAWIDPNRVRFSQESISYRFRNGSTIDDLAEGLRTGSIRPEDIPPIRLVERDGQLFTLDNRRLEAFRRAGLAVSYRIATPEEVAAEAWKFTTRSGGISIRIRGR